MHGTPAATRHTPPRRSPTRSRASATAGRCCVVAALLDGRERFNELQEELDGIAPNVLSARLKALGRARARRRAPVLRAPAALRLRAHRSPAASSAGALRLLADWGARSAGGAEPLRHAACGTPLEARWWCPTCEEIVDDARRERRRHPRLRTRSAAEQVPEPAAAGARRPPGRRGPRTAARAPSPGREKAIWIDSPEPRPIRFFILKSVLIAVVTPEDQVIAACASAKVGAEATLSSTGGPSERIATQPVPVQRHVEQAAGHRAARRPDALDVPVDAGVEGQQVRPVDGDDVVLEVDQVDVLRLVGDEHLAASRTSSSATCPRR